jgi:flagellar basal body P-ring formation protein FlgA
MKALTLALSLMLAAGPALAGPVTLKTNPSDDDGRVTLGDVFDDAGSAADVVIATRTGPSIVFEAGQLQGIALRSGLQWSNPQGLRRVVVRQGAATPSAATGAASASRVASRPAATVDVLTYARNLSAGDIVQPEDVVWAPVQSHQAQASGPQDAEQVIGLSARRALRAGSPVAARDLASPQVIARNDTVEVAFISGGVRLTVTGRATRNAAVGEPVPVLNLASGKTIEAVATGPGRAVTGPAAQTARSNSNQFARQGR